MKKSFCFILGALLLCSLLTACGKAELRPSDYIAWCDNPENNLVRTFRQHNTELTCQYTSPEYASLKQSDASNLDPDAIRENSAAASDLVQFRLKFRDTTSTNFLRNNYTTAEAFNTRSMYLSYDIRYDLKLVQGTDTTDCVLNHHERTYGSTPFETLLVAFPKSKEETTDLELIFDDRVFGLGRVKFFFGKESIESIPQLIF